MSDHKAPASQTDPAVITIFGITGDLAKRKLLPALYHLFKEELLSDKTRLIGISRAAVSIDDLLKDVELCVLESDNVCDPVAIGKFKASLQMLQGLPPTPHTDAADDWLWYPDVMRVAHD